MNYSFKTKVWIYEGPTSWYFANVPVEYSLEIKEITSSSMRTGFGSVKVIVNVGKSTWRTSIFPGSKVDYYVLPIKKEIRKKENIDNGSLIDMNIILADY